MNESKPNSGWNESKPTSGWNESKPSFPITMNVGEAMRCVSAGQNSSRDGYAVLFNLEIGTTLKAEVERLRAELAQLRKDWCDDDEAIKQQALRVLDAAKVEGDSVYVPRMGALAEMMADELVKVCAELDAAKAASVVPVGLIEQLKQALIHVRHYMQAQGPNGVGVREFAAICGVSPVVISKWTSPPLPGVPDFID